MIILDIDGVLANFCAAANLVNGIPEDVMPEGWNWHEKYGVSEPEFWENIHAHGEEFYGDMVKPYPWCREVVDLVRKTDDFVLMTSPSDHPTAYSGKKIWVDQYLPSYLYPKQLIVGSKKELLAGPDRLLIDDSPYNIEAFRKAGGRTFTFPQPWNETTDSDRLTSAGRVELLEACLAVWKRCKHVR